MNKTIKIICGIACVLTVLVLAGAMIYFIHEYHVCSEKLSDCDTEKSANKDNITGLESELTECRQLQSSLESELEKLKKSSSGSTTTTTTKSSKKRKEKFKRRKEKFQSSKKKNKKKADNQVVNALKKAKDSCEASQKSLQKTQDTIKATLDYINHTESFVDPIHYDEQPKFGIRLSDPDLNVWSTPPNLTNMKLDKTDFDYLAQVNPDGYWSKVGDEDDYEKEVFNNLAHTYDDKCMK